MKLSQAVAQVKEEKPNAYSDDHCTLFITEIEAKVQEVLGTPLEERKKYDWKEDGSVELVVPDPYSALYISYLKAKIDYSNEEYESYANNQEQFQSDFATFKAWAVREGKIQASLPTRIKNWW